MSIATTWGTTQTERSQPFPCDRHLENFDSAYYRGVTVYASPEITFRWLCQLRAAPYSYDWIDNRGRRSPQELATGLEDLALGQRVMRDFEIVEFAHDEHLTLKMRKWSRVFGDVAVSYVLRPLDDGSCRLLVKFVVRYPRRPHGWMMRLLLPWGDLVMMRRQLLKIEGAGREDAEAEQEARRGVKLTRERAIQLIAGAIGAFFFVGLGLWSFFDPRSFFEEIALFEPYNEHLFHDVGAFQIGIGSTLLLALVWRSDALLVALGGAAIGSAFHWAAHVQDSDLGGRDSDPWGLGLLAVVLVLAAFWKWTKRSV